MSLVRPPEWSEQAACLGLATRTRDPWTPAEHLTPEEKGFEWHLARRVCAGCPVRVECVGHELGMLEQYAPESMRGGLTPDELTGLARALGVPYRQRAQHGTRSRYVAGCRCDDCRAAHRVYEHERRLWARTRPPRPFAVIVAPVGSAHRLRHQLGQLVLFTAGLPDTCYQETA